MVLVQSVPQVPAARPLIGHLLAFRHDPLPLLQAASAQGPVARLALGPVALFIINDWTLIRSVLTDTEHYHKPARIRPHLVRLLGAHSVIMEEGAAHRAHRRRLAPSFTPAHLGRYVDAIRSVVRPRLADWTAGAAVPVGRFTHQLTQEVMALLLFGEHLTAAETTAASAAVRTAITAINAGLTALVPLPAHWPTPGNRRAAQAVAALDQLLDELLGRGPGGDLLQAMAAPDDGGTPPDMAQLRDDIVSIYVAGHETTAAGLAWTAWLLATHPAAQDALAAEVQAVLGDRPLTADDLRRLPVTRACWQEALRLWPPAAFVLRETVTAQVLGAAVLPAGSLVGISPYALHRDPRYWTDPDTYRPERWLTPGGPTRPPGYLPFLDGPRVCLGEHLATTEALVVLVESLRRWRLEPISGASPFPARVEVSIQPAATLRLRVQPRGGAVAPRPVD